MVPRESPTTKEVSCGWRINKLDEAAEPPSEISIILQIIRKPNSIVVLLTIEPRLKKS